MLTTDTGKKQLFLKQKAFATDFRGLSVTDLQVDSSFGYFDSVPREDEPLDMVEEGLPAVTVKPSSVRKIRPAVVDSDGQPIAGAPRVLVRGFKRVIYKLQDMEECRLHFHDLLKRADGTSCPGGHSGRQNTMKKFSMQYAMPGFLRLFWERIVKSCRFCQRLRGEKPKANPRLKVHEGLGTLWHWDVMFYRCVGCAC
jgi:hypothetical protein